jgi:hypothetical protein
MLNRKIIERVVYAIVIAACITAVVLAYVSLSFAVDTKVLYQGF